MIYIAKLSRIQFDPMSFFNWNHRYGLFLNASRFDEMTE